jgi:hypothetical protein
MSNLTTTEISSDNGFIVEQHFLGFQAKKFFPNGYGVSIVPEVGNFANLKSVVNGRSDTLGNEEYEVAVLHKENGYWQLCYNSPITNDVIRHLSLEEVLKIVEQVGNLPPDVKGNKFTFYTEEMDREDCALLVGVSPDEEWRLK